MSESGLKHKNLWLYEFQASLPATPEKRWRENVIVHVISDSLPGAFEIFTVEYPEADVHQIIKRQKTNNVLIDPTIIEVGKTFDEMIHGERKDN